MCFLYAEQTITFKKTDFQKTWDRFREANPAFGTSVMLPRPQGFDTIHPEFGWLLMRNSFPCCAFEFST